MNFQVDTNVPSQLTELKNVQVQTFESIPTTNAVPIVESSGKKRKLSSEIADNSEFSDNSGISGSEQFYIPVISETGDPLYHLQVVTVQECPQSARPVKTINEEELKTLRIQIAMLSDIDGDRPIHVAVVQENVKLVKKLCALMLKAAIPLDITNYNRQTALHLAVMVGNKELVDLLLKCGSCVGLRDRRGKTVLHLAVKANAKKDILTLILERSDVKAIVNMLDYEGYSALHYAIIKNKGCLIRCFHKFNADMNVPDGKSGRSPLIHAILLQSTETVRILLECGAAPETADYSGRSAFEFALLTSNKLIAKLLEKNTSNEDVVQDQSATKDRAGETVDFSTRTNSGERISTRSKRICRSNTYPGYEDT